MCKYGSDFQNLGAPLELRCCACCLLATISVGDSGLGSGHFCIHKSKGADYFVLT